MTGSAPGRRALTAPAHAGSIFRLERSPIVLRNAPRRTPSVELTVEKTASAVAKINFSVPADELRSEIERRLRHVSRNVRMKGFRPGKVPLKVIEKAYGEGVREEVVGEFVNQAYQRAIQENELKPMAHPRLSEDALSEREDGSIGAEFEVPLRPDFELPDYKSLSIESELEPVLDEQVDGALEELRNNQATPEPAGEDGLTEKGFALADVAFLHEGEAAFEREGMRLSVQSVPPGVDEAAFEEALLGARDGDVVEVPMTLPNYIEDEAKRGQEGTCRITVKEAFDLKPPADEDIFELLEVEDMDGLMKTIREKLEENAEARESNRVETQLLDDVLAATEVALPDPIVDQQTEARLSQLEQQLTEQGLPEEERQAQLDETRETARQEAEKGLKALLVVEAIGEAEELLVTNEEMQAELQSIAARNQAEFDEVVKFYSEGGRGQQLGIELLERKVRKFLRENADIQAPS